MLGLVIALALQSSGQPQLPAFIRELQMAQEPQGEIEPVLLSPLFRGPFVCGEHPAGLPSVVGDALGTDCQILGREDQSFRRLYRNEGRLNEDWYTFGAEVLAPFDGEVVGIFANAMLNEPGTVGRPPAGVILLRNSQGVSVFFAHVSDFAVAVGDRVRAGQMIAKVGNNGPSYAPHVHAGAYRGTTPLQIRWDQRALMSLMRGPPPR